MDHVSKKNMTEVTKTQNNYHSMASLIYHVHRKRNKKSTVVTKMQIKFPAYFLYPFHLHALKHTNSQS
jgi:hypothetical protein